MKRLFTASWVITMLSIAMAAQCTDTLGSKMTALSRHLESPFSKDQLNVMKNIQDIIEVASNGVEVRSRKTTIKKDGAIVVVMSGFSDGKKQILDFVTRLKRIRKQFNKESPWIDPKNPNDKPFFGKELSIETKRLGDDPEGQFIITLAVSK
jgi:hypothetical protein